MVRNSWVLPLALVALAACSDVRRLEGDASARAACTPCHGGQENDTGAPPVTIRPGGSGGAHGAHVVAGDTAAAIACLTCHPDPREDRSQHGNGVIDVRLAGIAGPGAAYDRATGTCSSVHCHGTAQPVWTATDGSAGACGACHGTPGNPLSSGHPALAPGWNVGTCSACHPETVDASGNLRAADGKHVDGTLQVVEAASHPAGWSSPTSHGAAAAQDVRACLGCHATKGPARLTNVVCASCHDPLAGGADWTVTCDTCHGSSAAPGSLPGAHAAHVAAPRGLSPALDCVYCHAKPATVTDAGHLDGQLTVSGYTGEDPKLAGSVQAPGWNGGSCASAYCHGNFPNGNARQPVWTDVGGSEGSCGSCHGLPPGGTHPAVGSDLATCNACHPDTVSAAGQLIAPGAGGRHLDGAIQLVGGHDAAWMDTAAAGFHANAALQSVSQCQVCHGDRLQGTSFGGSCGRCHDLFSPPPPGATFVSNCTACHGGTDGATGAPPRATWGHRGDALRVGAHTRHVAGVELDCGACHAKPTDAFTPGHLDGGTAEVAFGGIGAGGSWDRSSATCTTYCHGATLDGGTNTTPSWTGGAAEATCGSCHGTPPPPDVHPAVGSSLAGCNPCHPSTVSTSGTIVPRSQGGKHVDGAVQFESGHSAAFTSDPASPQFHALTANGGLGSCQFCHGSSLEGRGAASSCASCHDALTPAPGAGSSFLTNCAACHGDRVEGAAAATRAELVLAGAPDAAAGTTWGKSSDPIRVGAHAKHLASTTSKRVPCEACHVVPASALDAGHVSGTFATVTFSGLALQGLPAGTSPSWTRSPAPTCSSTYCHGATLIGGVNKTPSWTGGATQASCGSCHGSPPVSGSHLSHGRYCGNCHRTQPSQHVDGKKDVIIYGYDVSTPDACDFTEIVVTGVVKADGSWDCGKCHSYIAGEGDPCFP